MTNKTPIAELFDKYLQGIISPAELAKLLRYIEQSKAGDELTSMIQRQLEETDEVDDMSVKRLVDKVEAKVFADTLSTGHTEFSNRPARFLMRGLWFKVAAAAMIVVVIGLGWLLMRQPNGKAERSATVEADIGPGTNRATLTLANGQAIDLSADQSGIIVGKDIRYTDGSSVAGEPGNPETRELLRAEGHTLATPKGGTYQVTLPDGTHVWLNSASTLTYPSQFDDRERVVKLVGEAYFEVRSTNLVSRTSGAAWPFRVISEDQVVEVLGTEFNIAAYSDEQEIKTTLVKGRVRVSAANGKAQTNVLAPGQQLINRNGTVEMATVDVGDYIAWKQGQFVFYGTSMPALIKQIERWYDVSFEVTVPINDIELWGKLSRDVTLSEILHVIELNTPLKFTQEGRHVMVHR